MKVRARAHGAGDAAEAWRPPAVKSPAGCEAQAWVCPRAVVGSAGPRRGRGLSADRRLTFFSFGKRLDTFIGPSAHSPRNAAGILDVVKGTNNERKVLRFLFFFLLRGSATLGPNPARRIDFPPDEFATVNTGGTICSRRKYDFGP